MKARVVVTLKEDVLDPQGKAIETALEHMGFEGFEHIRQGKVFDLVLTDKEPEQARRHLDAACRRLLANEVIEDFMIEMDSAKTGS